MITDNFCTAGTTYTHTCDKDIIKINYGFGESAGIINHLPFDSHSKTNISPIYSEPLPVQTQVTFGSIKCYDAQNEKEVRRMSLCLSGISANGQLVCSCDSRYTKDGTYFDEYQKIYYIQDINTVVIENNLADFGRRSFAEVIEQLKTSEQTLIQDLFDTFRPYVDDTNCPAYFLILRFVHGVPVVERLLITKEKEEWSRNKQKQIIYYHGDVQGDDQQLIDRIINVIRQESKDHILWTKHLLLAEQHIIQTFSALYPTIGGEIVQAVLTPDGIQWHHKPDFIK